eukprot:5696212-Pyramimonas_sp.AAC.1
MPGGDSAEGAACVGNSVVEPGPNTPRALVLLAAVVVTARGRSDGCRPYAAVLRAAVLRAAVLRAA